MKSVWGVDHGEISKAGEADRWKMGKPLEKQGYTVKDRGSLKRLGAAGNKGAKKNLNVKTAGKHFAGGAAIGAGVGAGVGAAIGGKQGAKIGALAGGAGGAEAGVMTNLVRGMKNQNKGFRKQLQREIDRGAIVSKAKKKRDWSGAAVGTGSTVAAGGLLGGGIPGARPQSGRINEVKAGDKKAATRHLVSATRGGVFGYRQDAHDSFLKRQHSDLKGWTPTTKYNHFERGMTKGKVKPEIEIIRTMRRGRTASNAAFIGGAALAGAGALKAKKLKAKKSQVSKASKSERKADAITAAGATTAVGAGLGANVLNRQGRKWANRSARDLTQARRLNPELGGYDRKRPKSRLTGRPVKSRVPDIVPHRNSGDIGWNNEGIFRKHTKDQATAQGRLRGDATQARYFAKVYGSTARQARKVALAGAGVAGVGLAGKVLEMKPKYKKKLRETKSQVHKGIRPPKSKVIQPMLFDETPQGYKLAMEKSRVSNAKKRAKAASMREQAMREFGPVKKSYFGRNWIGQAGWAPATAVPKPMLRAGTKGAHSKSKKLTEGKKDQNARFKAASAQSPTRLNYSDWTKNDSRIRTWDRHQKYNSKMWSSHS